jgi:hypothetical protein
MPSDLTNLTTERSNLWSQMATMSANPKPTYTIGDQTVAWAELYKMLSDRVDAINRQIESADGPFELETRGIA